MTDCTKNIIKNSSVKKSSTKASGHFCSVISLLFEKIPITPDISVFIGDYINNTTFTRLSSVCIVIFVIFVIFVESTRSWLGY